MEEKHHAKTKGAGLEKAIEKFKKGEGGRSRGRNMKQASLRGCFVTRQVSRTKWPGLMTALSSTLSNINFSQIPAFHIRKIWGK